MKVMILAPIIDGVLNFRRELLRALNDMGLEVYVCTHESERVAELEACGCKFVPIRFNRKGTNPIKDILLCTRYWRLLRKIKPDIVLGFTIKPNMYGGMACQLLRIPFIPNITGLGVAVENPGFLQILTVTMYRVALRKTVCILFQNKANMDFFDKKRIVSKVKRRLLPGSGVNIQRFEQMAYPKADTTEFVFISRVIFEKGIDDYLYVAEKMKEEYGEKVVFHILGECEDEKYSGIINDFQERNIVVYHGRKNDIRPILERTHCTIHPSFYPEGMSNVCLESAAIGHPVITTKRAGCRETVIDGVSGFLFDEQDKEQLLAVVEKFFAMPHAEKEAMGIQARHHMVNNFDRDLVVKAYLNEINNVFNGNHDNK